ncbi:hypothetical protein [Kordiimonas pumila]|uniref:DUF4142 domain-containing protein n=1 Tax=Kordiimonas pumila TaxID=2161677 RepID=A0ABV7D7E5_9PROT|nr:hypothetical protein [Kordiimonas pumila]
MKTQFVRVAALGAAFVVFGNQSVFAGDEGAECLQPLMNFTNGLPVNEGASALSNNQKIEETTTIFKAAMKGATEAQECYAGKIAATSDAAKIEKLQAGAEEASRIFRLAQAQFEKTLDDISSSALSDMAPAAGPETAMGSDDTMMVDSMEQVFDSYMVLERSQQISAQFASLKAK